MDSFYHFPWSVWVWCPSGVVGASWHCLVGLATLHALSCPIVGSLLDQSELGPHPSCYINSLLQKLVAQKSFSIQFNSIQPVTPSSRKIIKKSLRMKMNSARMGSSKRRISSKGLGAVLREQRARLYIIRRCVVMLICWHD